VPLRLGLGLAADAVSYSAAAISFLWRLPPSQRWRFSSAVYGDILYSRAA